MPPQYAIGDLVEFNYRDVTNALGKYGIVIGISPRPNMPPVIKVQWTCGGEMYYEECHLIKVAQG
jgi:hypothetical protein